VIFDVNDFAMVYVNGQLITSGYGVISINIKLIAGGNLIQILCMTMGLVNFGPHMEQWVRGVGAVSFNGTDISKNLWQLQPGLLGEFLKAYTKTGAGIIPWNDSSQKAINAPLTWLKMNFDFPNLNSTEGGIALDLLGMNKGAAWVNGNQIGRYYLLSAIGSCTVCEYAGTYSPDHCRVGCGEPSQRYYHVPKAWLKEKDNLVILFEELGGDFTNVKLIERTGGTLCAKGQEIYPAENAQIYLRCPTNTYVQSVDFASFGTPQGTCGAFKKGSCDASTSQAIVEKYCVGESDCNIPVTPSIFGDPCPGTTKSLFVQVTCG